MGQLMRARRYPEGSRARREEGVTLLTFALDRAGRVVAASVARSSGHPALDAEALALVRRAEPLPPPPPEMEGPTVALTVPISFNLR